MSINDALFFLGKEIKSVLMTGNYDHGVIHSRSYMIVVVRIHYVLGEVHACMCASACGYAYGHVYNASQSVWERFWEMFHLAPCYNEDCLKKNLVL